MADELRFENESGDEINEIFFKKATKGISTIITKFYLKNLSSDRGFNGKLVVVPSYGRSYSEDTYISEDGEVWSKSIEFDLGPLERLEVKNRSVPVTTPVGVTGKASVVITGTGWY